MQIRYYKEYSRFLNRFMEFKVYGHAGRPIVIFPCQSGRFFDLPLLTFWSFFTFMESKTASSSSM